MTWVLVLLVSAIAAKAATNSRFVDVGDDVTRSS
jgi:hypothetical protein